MQKTVIDSTKRKLSIDVKELFQYFDLFITLAYRDIRVRYAQTFLGLFWAFLQPALNLLIFTVIFGKAINIDTGGVSYPIFAICGISIWSYFSFVFGEAGKSVIGAQEMVKKIYFPRLVIPLSKAVVGLVDLMVGLVFLLVLFIMYGQSVNSNIIFFPFFILLTIIASLGAGIWLSALSIRYRDFQYVVPFLVQFGLYATPIAYPTSLIISNFPSWATGLYYANPMVGIIEGFRWCLLNSSPPSFYSYISFFFTIVLFIGGLFYFKKTERVMADIV